MKLPGMKSARQAKGISAYRMARDLGVCPQVISRWENCHGGAGVKHLQRIADYLGVSLDQLAGRAPLPQGGEVAS